MKPYRDEDSGLMLLEPAVYIRAEGGWSVPDDERDRFYNAPYDKAPDPHKPRDLGAMLKSFSRYGFLTENEENAIVSAYEANPEATSHLVTDIELGCREGKIRYPTAVLLKRLKEVRPART